MEVPCTIVCFGDSITAGYFPYFRAIMQRSKNTEHVSIINRGVNGEKAGDGRRRLQTVIEDRPDVVVIGFGMNDYLKGNDLSAFSRDMEQILERLDREEIRIILNTLNPICLAGGEKEDAGIYFYNQCLKTLARKYALVVNDVYRDWSRELQPMQQGLVYENCDFIHPNHIGYNLIAAGLAQLVPRSITRIVWQFNGANAECNYRCPYCYQPADFHVGHHFMLDPETWKECFKKTFRHRRLNFYLSFGEPLIAKNICEVLDMIASEPKWKAIVLTNLSQDLEPFLTCSLAADGRFFLAASFHPSMTPLSAFMQNILLARRFGIEIPVVYVMWPPQIEKFEKVYFPEFQRNRVLVHIRRFRGLFKGRQYPGAYTWEQIKAIAKYMDDKTIAYMLCDRITSGKESFAGMTYLGVSNNGDLWVCPDWPGDPPRMGNIIDGTGEPSLSPMILGGHFSDGTTDGIANLLETNMDELDGNHILSYCIQTGFDFTGQEIGYPNLHTDFDDSLVQHRLGLDTLPVLRGHLNLTGGDL